MHYTVNITPCLFECTACPVSSVFAVSAATQLWMPHREGELLLVYMQSFSVLRSHVLLYVFTTCSNLLIFKIPFPPSFVSSDAAAAGLCAR